MYGYGTSERGTGTIRPKLLNSITNYKLGITTGSAKQILRVSEGRAELVRAMPSGSKMFYEVKELRITN